MPRKPEVIDIACSYVRETEKAYLLIVVTVGPNGEEKNIWFPKSQVEFEEISTGAIVTVPTWLAKEKDLI